MSKNTNPNTSSSGTPPMKASTSFNGQNLSKIINLIESLQNDVAQAQISTGGGTKAGGDGDGSGSSGGGEDGVTSSAIVQPIAGADGGSGGEELAATTDVAKLGLCGRLLSAVTCSTKESGGSGSGTGSSKQKAESSDKSEKSSIRSGSGYSIHGGGGDDRRNQMDKLGNNLDQIKAALNELGKFEQEFSARFKDRAEDIKQLVETLRYSSELPPDVVEQRLRELNKEVRKLKHRIPSSSSSSKASSAAHPDDRSQAPGGADAGTSGDAAVDSLLTLQKSGIFCHSSLYEEIKGIYERLEENKKKCLLCFSVFAENEELKKRMLAYWWEGEGFLGPVGVEKTAKEVAGEVLEKFVAEGLIEPVYKKRWPEAKRFRMPAVVRSGIIRLAEEAHTFTYDDLGNLAARYSGGNTVAVAAAAAASEKPVKRTSSLKKSVAAEPPSPSLGKVPDSPSNRLKVWSDEDKLETIFNVNEPFPDLRLKRLAKAKNLTAEEWLQKMKALKVLYLGTWRTSGKHHIEVDSTEFLKGLKHMSSLKLLSLQGISRINELTDSTKGLLNLEILDLKACHNLEELPKEISFLKNLTHLDVSNCFLIDHMPRGLASLTKLKVLKGFVVGDYRNQTQKFCTLESLAGMKMLRKLSIIISRKKFPTETELKALHDLEELRKLTLSWGADSTSTEIPDQQEKEYQSSINLTKTKKTMSRAATRKYTRDNIRLPTKLEKLDLQCYPQPTTPPWLSPPELNQLNKLYIRGGRIQQNLWLSDRHQWRSVRMLRLKYLAGMKMSWDDMQFLFPSLSYLEKVDCPLITLCPCDEDGVWVKESNNKHEPEQVEKPT